MQPEAGAAIAPAKSDDFEAPGRAVPADTAALPGGADTDGGAGAPARLGLAAAAARAPPAPDGWRPPGAAPVPKAASPWLEEDPAEAPERAGLTFSADTVQRRSRLLNRPPTPPRPRRAAAALSPAGSEAPRPAPPAPAPAPAAGPQARVTFAGVAADAARSPGRADAPRG
jgi:hypothetical protein